MIEGLVSTIIPVFNRPDLLREAVNSALAQDYRPIEILIVDDGSTDDTRLTAEDLQSENPNIIRLLHNANLGPGAAREAGRRIAKGEYIQYLDSDDLLLPGKFQQQVDGLRMNPRYSIAYGKTRHYPIGAKPLNHPWKRTGEKIETMFPSFLRSRWWGTSTPLYRRSVVERAGPWLDLRNEEDWEYDCRIASQGIELFYCPEFVSDQRDHPGDRLSRHISTDPAKLTDRATAHHLIYKHAQKAGISTDNLEMRHFARELFLLARQCGAAGLSKEAKSLFALARRASGPSRSQGFDFKLYHVVATAIGWSNAGRMARQIDKLRP